MFVPQYVSKRATHSYYTLGARYVGDKSHGITWQEFRKRYILEGGDGIYGAWSVPYLEPLISSKAFKKSNLEIYSKIDYHEGQCKVAERIQPEIMQFKTNYRDLRIAKAKASALERTIKQIEK